MRLRPPGAVLATALKAENATEAILGRGLHYRVCRIKKDSTMESLHGNRRSLGVSALFMVLTKSDGARSDVVTL